MDCRFFYTFTQHDQNMQTILWDFDVQILGGYLIYDRELSSSVPFAMTCDIMSAGQIVNYLNEKLDE